MLKIHLMNSEQLYKMIQRPFSTICSLFSEKKLEDRIGIFRKTVKPESFCEEDEAGTLMRVKRSYQKFLSDIVNEVILLRRFEGNEPLIPGIDLKEYSMRLRKKEKDVLKKRQSKFTY